MRNLKENKLTKKIISIIIFIMLCNFIMPNLSFAVSTGEGSSIIGGIAQFLCFIPDAIIWAFQEMFITGEALRAENGEYQIMYSPGIIFSGKIPAFDINFIKPQPTKIGTKTTTHNYFVSEALEAKGAQKIKQALFGQVNDIKKDEQYEYDETRKIDITSLEGYISSKKENEQTLESREVGLDSAWYNEDKSKIYIIVYDKQRLIDTSIDTTIILYEIDTIEALNEATKMTGKLLTTVEYIEYKSSAAVLQNIIATWYNVLKRIALVALLSVLVYIGIRIVFTSTSAKDKAKYKNMLKDWFVALCILFTLHYVMSITINVVDKLCEVLDASTIGANGQDILMSTIRNEIASSKNWAAAITYVIIYDTLVVFTVIYTVNYIRRVIHIGFLTTIAPLITLTYPLDKIKDSKSQAFDMWLKDYIFFTLLQVVHLLLYYIFLGSALDLSNKGNWLFAIVAIVFIKTAEKYVKKMFGFEKSQSINAIAAGATGALVTNIIDSVSKPTSAKRKGDTQKPVRTATLNPLSIFTGTGGNQGGGNQGGGNQGGGNQGGGNQGGGNQGGGNQGGGNQGGGNQGGGNQGGGNQGGGNQGGGNQGGGNQGGGNQGGGNSGGRNPGRTSRTIGKASTVIGRSSISVAKETLKAIANANLLFLGIGAVGASFGEKDITKIATAVLASRYAGGQIIENIFTTFNNIKETGEDIFKTWKIGTQGKEKIENEKFDRQFRQSSAYLKMKKEIIKELKMPEPEFERKVQQMLDSGITDAKKMKKILKKNKKDPRKYTMEKAIAFSTIAEMCPEDILYNEKRFIRFCKDKDINYADDVLRAIRDSVQEFR